MSGLFRWMTAFVLSIPVAFAVVGAAVDHPAARWMVVVAGALAILFAFTYLWMRPSHFEVSSTQLTVVFPLRRIDLARAGVSDAAVISAADFKHRFPRPLRVGVGGLWGGFGLLYTKAGRVQFYISRADGLVLVEFDDREPLLISPVRPNEVVEAVLERAD